MVRRQLHAPARAALLHPTCWTVRRSRSLLTVAPAHPCMRGPSQCHAQHTYAGTHKRAHTCVTHTPAHACCNNRQKGPMVDKFRLTALRRAQAWGPRPAVVGYMMFPSQGSRTVTCCCPAADYLRPCRRPPPLAPLVPCLLAPGPARPHLAAPHLPPTRGPRLRSGVWPGGGALAGGVAQPSPLRCCGVRGASP